MQNSHALNRIYSQAAFSQNTQDTHPSMPYAQNSEHHGESGTFGRYKMQAFQYYSFKQSQKSKEKEQEQQEEQSSYQNQSQRSCNTYKSKDDLLQKYESLCEKLKEVEPNEIVFLFIEEIEENERSKREITQKNHKLSSMEQTTAQLESVLAQKRNVIRKMCETQSKNLDIIECLESKLRCADFDFAEHYQNKYRQLQGYMNEYISSSGEAQEEMYKKISLLKNQNQRLVSENQTLSRSFFEKSKLVGVMELRQLKIETALSQSREEKKLVDRQVQRLQEQNLLLRKDVQSLIQTIKGYEQFEVDLNNKSNRQFSSSLEFIRQKLNTNSNAPFQPNLLNVQGKEVSKLYFSKDNQQIEGLKTKIQLLTEQKVQLQKQNHELMEDYQSLCHKMTKLTQQNVHFQNNIEKNQKDFQRMKQMQVEADDPRSMIAAKLDRSMLGFNLCDIQESLSLSSLKLQQFSGNESLGSIGKAYALGSVSSKFETKNKQNSTGGHL